MIVSSSNIYIIKCLFIFLKYYISDGQKDIEDELTTGLDVEARRAVWIIVVNLKKKGLTILLTTHYMEEAEKLCDNICIIKKGRIITKGSVESVINSTPHDNLEDAYLWYMNEEEE